MKTLHIGNDWIGERPGGLSRYLLGLTNALPNAGVSVRGMVVGQPSLITTQAPHFDSLASSGDKLPLRLWRSRSAIRKMLLKYRPDVLASHFSLYTLPALDLLRGVPMVVHFHGPWAAESMLESGFSTTSFVKRRLERLVYQRGQRFITLSQAFKQELGSHYDIPLSRIDVVPGGVDLTRFADNHTRKHARTVLGWPQERRIILCIRRHVRRMGIEALLAAIERVAREYPDILLLLAGSGPLTPAFYAQIATRGLENNARIIGRLSESDLPLAYRSADMSIVPSEALEGFGMVVVESLASGTPVLVTPVGGLPEIVQPFSPDCIFADFSAGSMERRLKAALSGEQILPSSQQCRAYASTHYGWDNIATRIAKIYQEALI